MKIVSLNVENGLHIERHMHFLREHEGDVYCFQEMPEPHLVQYQRELKCPFVSFVPLSIKFVPDVANVPEGLPVQWGIAIISKYELENSKQHHIGAVGDTVPHFDHDIAFELQQGSALQTAELSIDGTRFTVGNVHFPRGGRGQDIMDYQRDSLLQLIAAMQTYEELVMAGDLNSPRRWEIFDTIAEHFTDNIPLSYPTTIDINLHKNGAKDPVGMSELVIDCLFTTPHYSVSNVVLFNGVSDHFAVTGDITKH